MCGSGAPEAYWTAPMIALDIESGGWAVPGSEGSIESQQKYAVQDRSDNRGEFSTELHHRGSYVVGYSELLDDAHLFDTVADADEAIRRRPQGDTLGRFIVVPVTVTTTTETKTTTTTTRRKS